MGLAAAALGGCGGPGAALREDNRRLAAQVGELRAQGRRDRRTIEDLENQVLVLEDKVETAQVARDRAPGRAPRLPVVVLERETPAPAEPPPLDDDGVEIVYEGEAAREGSVRPSISLYEREQALEPPLTPRAPLPAAREGDRLPVTAGPVPPLSAAYRRAHAAPPVERPAATAPPARAPADPQAEYREYYAALRARDHAHAIAGFRRFLERWPRHDYADNAQYWLGEAYYDQKDFRTALAEFRAVVQRYPDGNKTPDALLKIGFCHLQLGEPAPARDVLRQLIEVHPRSDAAALAARRLAELDGE
jgi:tol-pal system protein YbgF